MEIKNEGQQGKATITDRRTETSLEEDQQVTSILMSKEVEVG
jgi:hypothetical protein